MLLSRKESLGHEEKLRTAAVQDEATDILFRMVEAARKEPPPAREEGKATPAKSRGESAVIGEASDKLQALNPERYAQLPPAPVSKNAIPF